MNEKLRSIEFDAVVAQVKTMADGGLRFVFDCGEDSTMQAAQLMECKRFGAVLQIRCKVKPVTECNDEAKKSTEGSPDRVGRRRSLKR